MQHPDSQRCLQCRRARCTAACPVGTDVATVINLYKEGRTEEAAALLFDNNPLSAVTSLVCDWKRFCFGHCVLNSRNVPIHWYEIEQELSTEYLKTASVTPGTSTGRTVGIVGAGPAGIAAAIFLRKQGHEVTLYDDHERPGGILRYGIPAFRLDKSIVDCYDRILTEAGIHFEGGVKTGSDITVSTLKDRHDAVILCAGAWKPRKLDIPGEDNPKVIYALEYLDNPQQFSLGQKVLVVGGGNVTMDASRTAKRNGSDVTIVYRKTFENMPANSIEIEDTRNDGVNFELFQVPVAVRTEGDKCFAVIRNCENVTDESTGKVRTRMIEGTDHEMEFDSMIVAISENVDYSIIKDIEAETDSKGYVITDDSGMTSVPGIFLCGDYLTGPLTVVQAVASAKKTVEGIAEFLK